MPELVIAIWVYFAACGFAATQESGGPGQKIMAEAPNIKGYWVRKETIIGIVDWRGGEGLACTSMYARGAPHPVHVIGTTEQILDKLRN